MTRGPRVLVTGASGFAGRHLAPALQTGLPGAVAIQFGGPRSTGLPPLDVTNEAAAAEAVASARPDMVVHLAGQADVAAANADPDAALRTNAGGTRAMAEAVLAHAPDALFLAISSSEVYGDSLAGGRPTPETAPLKPVSAYARSKAAAEAAVMDAAARGLHALIARPFNHTGPGQSAAFVAPAFAGQVAAIEAGTQPPVMRVGWLDDVRDFSDVRDIVRGYVLMLAQGRSLAPGTAINLASGTGRPVRDVLDGLRRLSTAQFEVAGDPQRQRAARLPAMVGDPALAGRLIGWRGAIAFETTLADVLAEARARTAAR
ncbi:MAG: GDP-mannose 4,6-dehydratase [Micropepsaceae bacterium]